jgi:hypothetical protein
MNEYCNFIRPRGRPFPYTACRFGCDYSNRTGFRVIQTRNVGLWPGRYREVTGDLVSEPNLRLMNGLHR